jgi:hypothetical protein
VYVKCAIKNKNLNFFLEYVRELTTGQIVTHTPTPKGSQQVTYEPRKNKRGDHNHTGQGYQPEGPATTGTLSSLHQLIIKISFFLS